MFFFLNFPEFKKVTIVSDSIAKNVDDIESVVVQSFSGDTVAKIAYKVDKGIARWDKFDYVLSNVGTNEVDNRASTDATISDFGNLLGIVKKKHPKINIIISSILPRPKDYDDTDVFTRRINSYLLNHMSKPYNFKSIKS